MERRALDLAPRIADPPLREGLASLGALATRLGGRALWVGGCVRDALLGRPVRDVDVELLGVDPSRAAAALREHLGGEPVGAAFPVWKLRGLPVDVSIAEPGADLPEAARRRDFTLDALAWDPEQGAVLDVVGGLADLDARRLRHTGPRFVEDPLRVLRGMQLVARFGLEPARETLALCRTLSPEGLPAERIFEEWRKLVLRGDAIGRGLAFLRDAGWLGYTPELEALVDCPQDPKWHPEGDVWVHTLHCMDAFARERVGDDREDLIVGLAVLCHDLGKPSTTQVDAEGRVRALSHESAGIEPTRRFLGRMTRETGLLVQVPRLVAAHLAPSQLHAQGSGDAAVRRLARRAGSIALLVRVAAADYGGRPPLPARPYVAGDWLLERARALGVLTGAPEPLLQGRHLVGLGVESGPAIGGLLRAAYEAQLDGELESEADAVAWARARVDEARGSGV